LGLARRQRDWRVDAGAQIHSRGPRGRIGRQIRPDALVENLERNRRLLSGHVSAECLRFAEGAVRFRPPAVAPARACPSAAKDALPRRRAGSPRSRPDRAYPELDWPRATAVSSAAASLP